MQQEKRPEFNRNKTGCPDASAIAGSLFILPSATVENAYRDWQPELLTTNTTVLWGEKCASYQAESSAETRRACVKWTNSEAKKGAINLSLCQGFRRPRQATDEERCGPCCQCSSLLYGSVLPTAGELALVHTVPSCLWTECKQVDLCFHPLH